MNPKDFLKRSVNQVKAMKQIKKQSVDVGVIASEATGRIYENGVNVLQVAAIHEFGLGNSPERSFLRMPQELKKTEIDNFIGDQLTSVLDGKKSVEKGLGLIGVFAVNISIDAFATEGFGNWPDIEQATKNAKGSSGILKDTGILSNSLTHKVK